MMIFRKPRGGRQWATLLLAPLLVAPLLLGGCSLELLNSQASNEIAPPPPPQGTIYAGWRVFQSKCARCHGADASGATAPDLRPIMRGMSGRRFANLVLKRYDLDGYGAQGARDQTTLETRIDDILQRRDVPVEMPAWQGEVSVNVHILDIYAYLAGRADGSVGSERPAP